MSRYPIGHKVRPIRRMFALAAALLFAFEIPLRAGFAKASTGVAAEALGGTFAAKADDPTAVFMNPAGISQLKRAEATFMYGKPYWGLEGVALSESHFAAGLPLTRRLTLGFGANLFDADKRLKEQETVVGASFQATPRFSVGLNLSYLYHSYSFGGDAAAAQDPVFANGRSKGALGVDAGGLFQATDKLRLGLSIRHLNKPDVGLASKDPVPMEWRTGAMYSFKRFNLLGDVMLRDRGAGVADRQELVWSLGGEWVLQPLKLPGSPEMALRAGVNSRQQLTAGFGVRVKDVSVDYAMTLVETLMEDNSGTHRLSLGYRFGPSRRDKNSRPSTSGGSNGKGAKR